MKSAMLFSGLMPASNLPYPSKVTLCNDYHESTSVTPPVSARGRLFSRHAIGLKLGALALAAVLAGCATDGSGSGAKNSGDKGSADKSSGLSSALSGLGSSSSGSANTNSRSENKVGAALDVFKAVTVSDDEVKSVSLQMRQADDKKYAAAGNNKYAQRLKRLTSKYTNEDGLKLNFKVYMAKDVNANASLDGSVRVYSGLMDMMNDQELLGVIGHEIGHVKLGHTMTRIRTAYLASAGRKAAASSKGAVGALSSSELGALGEALTKSQFSQSQETESDEYGVAFLKKHHLDPKAMESALRKLATLSGKKDGLAGMLSSHPDPGKRAEHVHELAAK